MDDRSRREEEERREAEQRRRREEPRPGAGGRHREELFDEELFGSLESGLGRSSRSRRVPPEDSSRVQDREPVLEPGDPGRGRRRSPARGQSRGLYGSQISSNILRSAVAEFVGTFILVFTGTAVAVAAILQRSTVGPPGFYDSLAVALAFGLALAALVAAIGHVSGAHVNPAVTLGLVATNKFPWNHVPTYGAEGLPLFTELPVSLIPGN